MIHTTAAATITIFKTLTISAPKNGTRRGKRSIAAIRITTAIPILLISDMFVFIYDLFSLGRRRSRGIGVFC